MASGLSLWAAVAARGTQKAPQERSTTKAAPPAPSQSDATCDFDQKPERSSTAFISEPFIEAIALFYLMQGGADTMTLAYLRSHGVSPSRITVYMHTPRPNRKLNEIQVRINKMRLGPEVEETYKKEGYNMKVVIGYHNERDAAMTEDSDYDILCIRSKEETRSLYGAKYWPGRISGTQKYRDRRLLKESRRSGTDHDCSTFEHFRYDLYPEI